jgi:hypothetical protein
MLRKPTATWRAAGLPVRSRRLVRRAILESTILASAGAMLAFFVAWGLARLLIGLAPSDVPRLAATTVFTSSVIAVAAGLALTTSVVSGVWPAVFVGRVDPARVLTSGARTAMLPRERLLQRLVVGWQVAVAVILLTGSALFIRSVQRLERTPLGFTPGNLVAIELQPSAGEFAQWDQFFESLSERVAGLPAVRAVGAIARRPLSGPIGNDTIPVLKGQEGLGPDAPWRRNPRANLQAVTPGYFRAVGARLIAGRDFTDADVAIAPNVVIVGASTAARFWPDRDPVGELMLVPTQRLPGSLETPRWQVVVGVVEDVRYRGITDPRLDVYMPAAQSTIRVGQVLVRTSGPPAQVIADVQQIAHALDPAVLTGEVVTLADVVALRDASAHGLRRARRGAGGGRPGRIGIADRDASAARAGNSRSPRCVAESAKGARVVRGHVGCRRGRRAWDPGLPCRGPADCGPARRHPSARPALPGRGGRGDDGAGSRGLSGAVAQGLGHRPRRGSPGVTAVLYVDQATVLM